MTAPTPDDPTPAEAPPLGFSAARDDRVSRLLLSKAMRMASVGAWSLDLVSGELTWSEEVFRIHDLEPGPSPSVEEAVSYYAPGARERVEAALEGLIERGETFDFELPLVTARGREIWVRSIGDVDRDAGGRATMLYGVFQDITHQVALAAEREKARVAAEAATRAKSEFLATMSHELRTPMNGILGMSQLLAASELDPAQRECVEAIERSGGALMLLLSDLLDVSRADAGQIALEQIGFDVEDAVREIVDLVRDQRPGHALELRLAVGEEVGARLGDPARLRQIVVNLVGNAVKFTERGHVHVTVTARRGRVRVEVADTGIGVDPAKIPLLFEDFRQADGSNARRFGGTGLGLALCRRLVELMGGEIGVESEVGVGSTFWFEVPLERAIIDAAPGATSGHDVEATGTRVRPLRVLVVEDHPVNRAVAQRLIELLGHEAVLAENGREGVDEALASAVDVVLMDCQMPVMDGFEATRMLRRRERERDLPRVPILALTANALPGDRERCLDAGMDAYMSKPVRREMLAAMLEAWTPGRDAGQA